MSSKTSNKNKNKNKKKKKTVTRIQQVRVRRGPKIQQTSPMNTLLSAAGNVLSKGLLGLVTGFGDYKIYSNSLMGAGLDPPQVSNSNNGAFIIRHREYIGDVPGTINFTQTTYALNPGIPESFPWLCGIASQFEQYKWRGMIFEFKSLSSDAVLGGAPNSALGAVMMATQYDPLNIPFIDKHALENYLYASSEKPSVSFIHPIECARNQTPVNELFIRTGAPPVGADLRFYDLGITTIATQGQQASGGVLGELWCSYEVELYKPKLNAGTLGFEILADSWYNTTPSTVVIANPLGTFGSFWTHSPNSNLAMTVSVASRTWSFPATLNEGVYLMTWSISGTAAVCQAPTITTTNCVAYPYFYGTPAATPASGYNTNGLTSGLFIYEQAFQITNAPAVITFGVNGVYPTAPTGANFNFTQLNEALL